MAQHSLKGNGAPTFVPARVLQHYLDETSKTEYVSCGITSVSDWKTRQVISSYLSSFNSRSGAVIPQAGDYSAADVGADSVGTAASLMSSHTGSANPHSQYVLNSQIGAPSGVVPLGADSKIAPIFLPSFVDDALEFTNLSLFPLTGESGKIYTSLDTGLIYRWSGSVYIEISPSPGSTDVVSEGATNLYFRQDRVLATLLAGLSLSDSNDILETDTLVVALGKLQAQLNLSVAPASIKLKTTANLTNNSNTTGVQIPELGFSVVAGKTYRFSAFILHSSTATTSGLAIGLTTTDTAAGTLVAQAKIPISNTDGTTSVFNGAITAFNDYVTATSAGTIGTNYLSQLNGTFVATVSGTIVLIFRSEVNGQTITVRSGSNLVIEEI